MTEAQYQQDLSSDLPDIVDEWLADLEVTVTFWLNTVGEMKAGFAKLREVFPGSAITLDFDEAECTVTATSDHIQDSIKRVCEGILFEGWTVEKAREELAEAGETYYLRNYQI